MSGTDHRPPPKTNQELVRDMDRRIDKLERPSSVRVGRWVLSTSSDTGNLIASHGDGGSVVLATVPPSTQQPDEVVENVVPKLRLRRLAVQEIPENTITRVEFDTIDVAEGGWSFNRNWGASNPNVGEIIVPATGWYVVVGKTQWQDAYAHHCKTILNTGGQKDPIETDVQAQITQYVPAVVSLTRGQSISMSVWNEFIDELGEAPADPGSWTSLSIMCVERTGDDNG